MAKTNCDTCVYYEYDEDFDCYTCSMEFDEDEAARFVQDAAYSCPYYKFGDEYMIVKKQM